MLLACCCLVRNRYYCSAGGRSCETGGSQLIIACPLHLPVCTVCSSSSKQHNMQSKHASVQNISSLLLQKIMTLPRFLPSHLAHCSPAVQLSMYALSTRKHEDPAVNKLHVYNLQAGTFLRLFQRRLTTMMTMNCLETRLASG
jgi:hypothetical protein